MSAATASQLTAAHQLREDSAELEVKSKTSGGASLSGPVQAELSYSAPPEDGSTVRYACPVFDIYLRIC